MSKIEELIRSTYNGKDLLKRLAELEVLNKIYRDDKAKIELSEHPDFIIENDNNRFGVEITRYYHNESCARLKEFEGYSDRIKASVDNSVLDKKDKDVITKIQSYIQDTRNNQWLLLGEDIKVDFNGMNLNRITPKNDYAVQELIKRVNEKSENATNYSKMDYYELFISDEQNYFCDYLKDSNSIESIISAVNKSIYKRVYLFSNNHLFVFGNMDGIPLGGGTSE